MLNTKEFYDVIDQFERSHLSGRKDKEKNKELWKRGHVYENGEVNEQLQMFLHGYCYAKSVFIN